jgi:hypothetical protein
MSEILPLAFTMMVGPQIITSIVLATADKVVKPSLAYVAGIGLATTLGTVAFFGIATLFRLRNPSSHDPSHDAKVLQTILVLLLALLALWTWHKRATTQLPSWMGKLQTATPKTAFRTALLLIFLMPADLLIMSTVGINLASHQTRLPVVPFVGLTMLIAAAPLIAYLVFHRRAVVAMPKVRAWMDNHSWVIAIGAYAIFIALLWP